MQKQSNTGWLVLGAIGLLIIAASTSSKNNQLPVPDYNQPPDTADNPQIIIPVSKT